MSEEENENVNNNNNNNNNVENNEENNNNPLNKSNSNYKYNNKETLKDIENKSRSEFIENFQETHSNISKNNTKSKELKGRWNLLYNHGKLLKKKTETYRQKELEKRNKEEVDECTFKPKINKNFQFKIYEQENQKTNGNINYLLSRQKLFLTNKNSVVEQIRQEENEKEMEECKFVPKTVKFYIIIFNIFRIKLI
jgi:hypothetical protein